MTLKSVLSIAGSDSSGGAGIQADIKTIQSLGLYAQTVITAITAQNTFQVTRAQAVDDDLIQAQIDAVFADIVPNAVKIGMVATSGVMCTIAQSLRPYVQQHHIPVVLDPVMVSTSGALLIERDAVATLLETLVPLAQLITPNLREARVLVDALGADAAASDGVVADDDVVVANDDACDAGIPVPAADAAAALASVPADDTALATSEHAQEAAALRIARATQTRVLVKGGHAHGHASDVLAYPDGRVVWFRAQRIDNKNNHGSGCTLSSALACAYAQGKSTRDAVQYAKNYVQGALSAQLNLGKGSGPLNHNWMHAHAPHEVPAFPLVDAPLTRASINPQ